jgi:hypothetical protein
VFEAATGKELSSLAENGPVHSVAFSPDGAILLPGARIGAPAYSKPRLVTNSRIWPGKVLFRR